MGAYIFKSIIFLSYIFLHQTWLTMSKTPYLYPNLS